MIIVACSFFSSDLLNFVCLFFFFHVKFVRLGRFGVTLVAETH